MTVKIKTYDVLLSTGLDEVGGVFEHRVRILNGDQLRAELEGPRHNIRDLEETPMHFITLWIWAALTREHKITDDFAAFKPRLLAYSKVEDDPSEAESDPTPPGAATD